MDTSHSHAKRQSKALHRPSLPLWVKVTTCLLIGLIIAAVTTFLVRQAYLESLSGRVETIAYLISSERVSAIATNAPGSQEHYDTLKSRLMAVKTANDDARFLYIMAREDNNQIVFLVDSEQPGTDGYSPRGEAYPDASEALIAMFDNGETLIEGPVSDRWGNWLSAVAPIKDEQGKVVGVVGLDIPSSAYISLLVLVALLPLVGAALVAAIVAMLHRARRKRFEAVRMRSELVSIASHELKTPLSGIRWGEEVLQATALGEKEAKIVENMHSSTLQLEESIEDILQLASLQTIQSSNFHMVTTNIVEMINSILMTQRLTAQQKGVRIEFGPNWPVLVMVNCDPLPMKRVFNNLINNAIKYTRPNTAVTIDYEFVDSSHVFTIADQGIGIPKHEQSKVFTGFYRASNAVAEGISGTGMGLYLSQTVVEKHGGKLWLNSEEGKGTTIYVRLPSKQ